MNYAISILLGLFCVPLLVQGLRLVFAPAALLSFLAVEPEGPVGMSTVRGILGGAFLGSGAMLGLGLGTGDTVWFLAVGLLMGVVATGRVVGILMDGFDRMVLAALVPEVLIMATAILAHVRFTAA